MDKKHMTYRQYLQAKLDGLHVAEPDTARSLLDEISVEFGNRHAWCEEVEFHLNQGKALWEKNLAAMEVESDNAKKTRSELEHLVVDVMPLFNLLAKTPADEGMAEFENLAKRLRQMDVAVVQAVKNLGHFMDVAVRTLQEKEDRDSTGRG